MNTNMIESVEQELLRVQHGFKPIENAAASFVKTNTPEEALRQALKYLESEHYQLRSVGVFMLAWLAAKSTEALRILKEEVSKDASWQVQEILAKAFDQYCKDTGYEEALPEIEVWLASSSPNVCRAVTEGLRIWTGRPYFKEHPDVAVRLICQHKNHESEYLRKSVGNALRDIAKKHPDLIGDEIKTWDIHQKKILFTYKLVCKR